MPAWKRKLYHKLDNVGLFCLAVIDGFDGVGRDLNLKERKFQLMFHFGIFRDSLVEYFLPHSGQI